jgi:hypothetical protein
LKGLGYLISTVSVFLLGAAGWPKPDDPPQKMWLVIGGMVTSVLGMFFRFLSHRKEKAEIKQAERT